MARPSKQELESMSVAELKSFAADNEIILQEDAKKADLVKAILLALDESISAQPLRYQYPHWLYDVDDSVITAKLETFSAEFAGSEWRDPAYAGEAYSFARRQLLGSLYANILFGHQKESWADLIEVTR